MGEKIKHNIKYKFGRKNMKNQVQNINNKKINQQKNPYTTREVSKKHVCLLTWRSCDLSTVFPLVSFLPVCSLLCPCLSLPLFSSFSPVMDQLFHSVTPLSCVVSFTTGGVWPFSLSKHLLSIMLGGLGAVARPLSHSHALSRASPLRAITRDQDEIWRR